MVVKEERIKIAVNSAGWIALENCYFYEPNNM